MSVSVLVGGDLPSVFAALSSNDTIQKIFGDDVSLASEIGDSGVTLSNGVQLSIERIFSLDHAAVCAVKLSGGEGSLNSVGNKTIDALPQVAWTVSKVEELSEAASKEEERLMRMMGRVKVVLTPEEQQEQDDIRAKKAAHQLEVREKRERRESQRFEAEAAARAQLEIEREEKRQREIAESEERHKHEGTAATVVTEASSPWLNRKKDAEETPAEVDMSDVDVLASNIEEEEPQNAEEERLLRSMAMRGMGNRSFNKGRVQSWSPQKAASSMGHKYGTPDKRKPRIRPDLNSSQAVSFSVDVLRGPPDKIPGDVDLTKKEEYLLDSEFWDVFSMTKLEFSRLPDWKKRNLKQGAKLH